MEISTYYLEEGAKQAQGLTVIIDVFRAFTLEPYLYGQGAKEIYAVGSLEKAYSLQKQYPDAILIGERNGAILPGFDYGNSPSALCDVDFTGKTIFHTTTNGTRGMMNAVHAQEMIVGSFVNAKAIATYIQKRNPEKVSLVAMGWKDHRTPEDDLCAAYLTALLQNREMKDIDAQLQELRFTEGKKFFDPLETSFPEGDFAMCIDRDRFSFVIQCEKKGDLFLNRKVEVYA